MDFPRRVFDGEGVKGDVDFGPTLMLNRQRCILCTRCVRFMREVDADAQIGIVDRGYGSEIATFQEQGVHSLLSGNLMDVCPVGAITTRDYRFKSRPWDNPAVVDTICTLCSKGCNTSAWLKAKPEWAKGTQLIRMTPRFNPDVNSYWMCDIGRFEYHWVEGDARLRRPMLRSGAALENASWHDVELRLRDRMQEAGAADPASVRFLVSAHAATEELFVLKQMVEGLIGADGLKAVTVTWTRSEKRQPAGTKFRVPPTNAPNVNGARDLGFAVGHGNDGMPDVQALRTAVEAGRVQAVYVLDPGPAGSLGDVTWLVEARRSGTLPLLVVQGVMTSDLVEAADIVLPGTTYVEKDAIYTNEAGRVQAASRVIAPPGDAREDWLILADLARSLGLQLAYQSSNDVRRAIAAARAGTPYADADKLVFTRPIPARNWLQASNPSERWKWDFMFQDLPPVKGHNVQMEGLHLEGAGPNYIPLLKVEK
jgi:NADH-quinone oxidoreductase subunit G